MTAPSPILLASVLAGLNVLLLLVLTVVWVRNYRDFRTPLVLGLLAFALAMLAENAVALYFFLDMRMLYASDPTVKTAVAVLRALQFVAVAFLTWVTLK